MKKRRLAQVVVALVGALVTLGLMGGSLMVAGMANWDSGRGGYEWLYIPAVAIPLGYGLLVILALRGHRAVSGILAGVGWLIAVNVWLWLAGKVADPYESLSTIALSAALAIAVTAYAVAATYLVVAPAGGTPSPSLRRRAPGPSSTVVRADSSAAVLGVWRVIGSEVDNVAPGDEVGLGIDGDDLVITKADDGGVIRGPLDALDAIEKPDGHTELTFGPQVLLDLVPVAGATGRLVGVLRD
jgi:hypothetical protein